MLNEGGQNYSANMPVDVGNSNIENVTLALSTGVDIAGKFRIEGVDLPRITLQIFGAGDKPSGFEPITPER